MAKTDLFKCKNLFKKNPSNENKINFLKSRNHFAYIKRKGKKKKIFYNRNIKAFRFKQKEQ